MKKIKESGNPISTSIKRDNEKNILNALLNGEKSVNMLMNELDLSHQTMAVRLADMENKGFIKFVVKEDRRQRFFNITSKGEAHLLNTLDIETRGRIFTSENFAAMNDFISIFYINDVRLSKEETDYLYNHFKKIIKAFGGYGDVIDNNNPIPSPLIKEYSNILRKKNLPILPANQIILQKDFIESLTRFLGEITLYIALKSVEEKNREIPKLLTELPFILAAKLNQLGANVPQFKDNIIHLNTFDEAYNTSKNTTLSEYKNMLKFMSTYEEYFIENNIDEHNHVPPPFYFQDFIMFGRDF